MLLGKRPRPPAMRRTRSMSGGMAADAPPAANLESHHVEEKELIISHNEHDDHHPPQNQTISKLVSQPIIQTPHFLRTCGLCNCRLAPGRDIYMYRGDTAFCSLECREQQIKQDQRKEKWKVTASIKADHHHRRHQPTAAAATAKAFTST